MRFVPLLAWGVDVAGDEGSGEGEGKVDEGFWAGVVGGLEREGGLFHVHELLL